jgi:RNA-binding protein YlmH
VPVRVENGRYSSISSAKGTIERACYEESRSRFEINIFNAVTATNFESADHSVERGFRREWIELCAD